MVLRVLADVCGGLHTAHELREVDDGPLLGVVHRDVSPQNVLVSTKGVAKLIDFGIAKARDRIAGDTNAGQVKGKIRYMAPEQAVGGAVDRRADIWAVGAILYHLLSGKPPYDGENDVQALMVLTSGRPPVPLPATVHPAIAAIVKRALTFGRGRPIRDGRGDAAGDRRRDGRGGHRDEPHRGRHVPGRARGRAGQEAQGSDRDRREGCGRARALRRDHALQREGHRTGSGTVASVGHTEGGVGTGGSRSGQESNPGVGSPQRVEPRHGVKRRRRVEPRAEVRFGGPATRW